MEKIVVYTQPNCRSSDKLKQLLNSRKVSFLEKDISHHVLFKREMIERTGGRSATPQVFCGREHILDIAKFVESFASAPRKLNKAA